MIELVGLGLVSAHPASPESQASLQARQEGSLLQLAFTQQTAPRVAVLLVGGLRGLDITRTRAFGRHVLRPLAQHTGSVDLFACLEQGDVLSSDLMAALERSGASILWPNASLMDVTGWAQRLHNCYTFAKSHEGPSGRYDFFLRTRPDLVWEGALPPAMSWSTTSVSVRYRIYAGAKRFTAENQAYSHGSCGAGLTAGHPCAGKGKECFVPDDQLFIVPAKHADVVMSYWPDDNMSYYQDSNWCDQPYAYRLLGDDWHCISWAEMHWGYYLGRNGVDVQLLAARAWLLKHGPPPHGWTASFECSGPHAATRAEREELERRQSEQKELERRLSEQVSPEDEGQGAQPYVVAHEQEQDATAALPSRGERTGTRSSGSSRHAAAAICVSGQVRTIRDVYETIRVRLVDPFASVGGARVFMHASLTSEYPPTHPGLSQNGRWTMTEKELQPALQGLGVQTADLTIYEEGTAYDHDAAKIKPSDCYKDPNGPECSAHNGGAECHGPQFWGVSKCFAQILRAEHSQGKPFQFTIRARTDSIPVPEIVDVIPAAVSSDPKSPSWVRMASGVGADGLLLAKGSEATQAIASIFDEFNGTCSDPDPAETKQLCDPFQVVWFGTECLLVRHIHAAMGRTPIIDDRVRSGFMRPVNSDDPSALAPCAPRCGLLDAKESVLASSGSSRTNQTQAPEAPDIVKAIIARINTRKTPTAPFTFFSWGDSTMMRLAQEIVGQLDQSAVWQRHAPQDHDHEMIALKGRDAMCRVTGFTVDRGSLVLSPGSSTEVTIAWMGHTHCTLDFAEAGDALEWLVRPASKEPYSTNQLPYHFDEPDLVLAGVGGLHYMHREEVDTINNEQMVDPRAVRNFVETKGFANSSTAYKSVVRNGLRALEAAFPRANRKFFTTHSICDERLPLQTMTARATACARWRAHPTKAAADACFSCDPGASNCYEPLAAQHEWYVDSLFSHVGASAIASLELAVLDEFRDTWGTTDAHGITAKAGCDATEDGAHYDGDVVAQEALSVFSL